MIKNTIQNALDHRVWRFAVITAPNYYFLSWSILLATTLGLTALSHATTFAPLIASAIVCAVCVLGHRRLAQRSLRTVRLGGYAVSLAIVLWAFFVRRAEKDFATIAMETLLAVLPALMQNMTAQRRVFAAITVTNLISLGAVMLADNLDSYGAFLAFILAMAMTLNAARMYFLSVNAGDATERLTVNFFYQLVRAIPIGVIFGGMIFYWFPRVNDLALDFNLSGVKSRTGYSNQVNLGGKGSIEESNRVYTWISSRDTEWLANNGTMLYLRGATLDAFNGKTWQNSGKFAQLVMQTADFRVGKAHTKAQMELSFFREPTAARELLVPYGLWNLEIPMRINQETIVDTNGTIILNRDESMRYHYDLRFSPPLPNLHEEIDISLTRYRGVMASLPPQVKRYFELSADDAKRLTEIPAAISSQPWFEDFVQKVNNELGAPAASMGIGHILRNLQRHYRQQYTASLKFEFTGDDNLRQFLTTGKEGHCELFATSAALYLRNLGIPARLVSGYHGGQFNVMSSMLEVPERNAHVWLEVFSPGVGWLPYDPTPLVLQTSRRSTIEEAYVAITNAVRFWFIRYVIDYDAKAQKELVITVSHVDMSRLLDVKNVSWDQNTTELTMLGVLLAISGWLLMRVLTKDDHLPDAPVYYRALAERLISAGFTRKKGESYLEFHKRLLESGINPDLVSSAHHALERDLYRRDAHSRTEQRILNKALRKMPLKQKIKPGQQNDPSQQLAHG